MGASTKTKAIRGTGDAAAKRTARRTKSTSKRPTKSTKSTASAKTSRKPAAKATATRAKSSAPSQPTDVKPTFLGLLNAIAVAEHGAHDYLMAWADTTSNDELADVLRFVAVREGEHYFAFRKRIVELGYDVRFPDDAEIRAKNIELARSSISDAKKWRHFDLGKVRDYDVFDDMFHDKTIDPQTGGLLGRYITEERDSTRRFAACYASGTVTGK